MNDDLEPCAVQSWIDPEKILTECHSLCPEVLEQDAEVLEGFYLKAASFFYWQTGFRWPGCCPRVAEPCWEGCGCGALHWGYKFKPIMIGGQWMNLTCGCFGQESCCDPNGIPLIPAPKEVTSVMVDGVTLDPAAYECRNGKVVRLDGGAWPDCGGIKIEYLGGKTPPEWVACAAREYARELICECFCPSKCSLPKGWQQANFGDIKVSRENVQITPSIDRVLNDPLFRTPSGQPRRPARVWSADVTQPFAGYLV